MGLEGRLEKNAQVVEYYGNLIDNKDQGVQAGTCVQKVKVLFIVIYKNEC